VGKVAKGQMSQEELEALERAACPGYGSCAGMFTANTMNCLTEALGMGLPGNGTIPAVEGARLELARRAGQQVMELLKWGIRPLDIITKESIINAFRVDMALGGSTNSVLHLMAIAYEAGIDFPLSEVNRLSRTTPHLCKLSPAGDYHIEDLNLAGGIPAVMKEIELKTPYKVVGTPDADSVLSGRIIGETKHMLIQTPTGEPRQEEVGLQVKVSWIDRRGGVLRNGAPIPLEEATTNVNGASTMLPEIGQSVAHISRWGPKAS
jgi:dihydroxy-acid dehydratase